MKKKLLSLALVVGAGLVTAKVISGRKDKAPKDKDGWNDILGEYYSARYKKESGTITEQKYQKLLNTLHDRAKAMGELVVNELLEGAYAEAEYAAECHMSLMRDVKTAEASSLEDFIRKFPDKAYENGVLGLNEYCFEEQARTTADYIANKYYETLQNTESRLMEFVEMLEGDVSKVKRSFDITRAKIS